MPKAMKGEAAVELSDGRTLTLVFDFDAWAEAEDAAGKSIGEIMGELQSGKARLKTQRALIFGALHKHHPDIELADIGPLLLSESAAFAAAMTKGMAGAAPPPEPDAEGEEGDGEVAEDPPTNGTGTAN